MSLVAQKLRMAVGVDEAVLVTQHTVSIANGSSIADISLSEAVNQTQTFLVISNRNTGEHHANHVCANARFLNSTTVRVQRVGTSSTLDATVFVVRVPGSFVQEVNPFISGFGHTDTVGISSVDLGRSFVVGSIRMNATATLGSKSFARFRLASSTSCEMYRGVPSNSGDMSGTAFVVQLPEGVSVQSRTYSAAGNANISISAVPLDSSFLVVSHAIETGANTLRRATIGAHLSSSTNIAVEKYENFGDTVAQFYVVTWPGVVVTRHSAASFLETVHTTVPAAPNSFIIGNARGDGNTDHFGNIYWERTRTSLTDVRQRRHSSPSDHATTRIEVVRFPE